MGLKCVQGGCTAYNAKTCCGGYRYIILAIGLMCLVSIYANYNVINFTFICMTGDVNDTITTSNGTLRNRYDYTPTEKSMIIWAVAVGTLVGTFPINYLNVRFGSRIPFFAAGVLSGIATLAMPWAAAGGLPYLLILRVIQGISYAADFAAIGVLCVRWAPLYQTGTFIGFLTSFSSIASAVTNPITGALCESSLGWRWSFYFHAMFCFVVFTLWLFFYSDDPDMHRHVSESELEKIQKDKTPEHVKRDSYVPYWDIIKSPTILVVWANALTELVANIIISSYAPIYINKVLGYDVGTTAALAGIGAFIHFPMKLISSVLSDYITCISEKIKMNFFNTVSVGISGILCGLIGFAAPIPGLAVAFLTASFALMSFNCGGFYKCGTFHSRQYAHFVLATIQFSKCVALFIGPALVAIFLKTDSDAGGWKIIFIINAAMCLVANVLFYFVCTDQPAAFTRKTRATEEAKKKGKKDSLASDETQMITTISIDDEKHF